MRIRIELPEDGVSGKAKFMVGRNEGKWHIIDSKLELTPSESYYFAVHVCGKGYKCTPISLELAA